jgi:hypothetical protein
MTQSDDDEAENICVDHSLEDLKVEDSLQLISIRHLDSEKTLAANLNQQAYPYKSEITSVWGKV